MSLTDVLDEGWGHAALLTRQHGTTYWWGAQLLSPRQRRDVYTVYALCRLADDIVDEPDRVETLQPLPGTTPRERLRAFAERFDAALQGDTSLDPVLVATARTVRDRRIPHECFERFFGAMALDLHRTEWATWEDLRDGYMDGSAAVIGEMMLPILEPLSPEAARSARCLGLAFQLTNFLRDVGEDLDRGRVYLPQDVLTRHDANPHLRTVTPQWRAAMGELIALNRDLYAEAAVGIELLPPGSARCVATAHAMYSRILDRIEAADYDVFSRRRRVPRWRKATLALRFLATRRPRAEHVGSGTPASGGGDALQRN